MAKVGKTMLFWPKNRCKVGVIGQLNPHTHSKVGEIHPNYTSNIGQLDYYKTIPTRFIWIIFQNLLSFTPHTYHIYP